MSCDHELANDGRVVVGKTLLLLLPALPLLLALGKNHLTFEGAGPGGGVGRCKKKIHALPTLREKKDHACVVQPKRIYTNHGQAIPTLV